ncbi:MAG: Rieske 2Fe-2S domain-containing protein [Gammaproteobacteria bacterium]|nr:Rieske 2Fe-2S domain-containing protein [Gammaproteobacteria bacterium]
MAAPRNAPQIVEILRRNAAREFAAARSLPPAIYHDADIFAMEVERIFYRDWICIGRLGEIPDAGDYVAVDIVGRPVFVVRQKDMSVKAFSNVCPHRGSRLVDDCGRARRFVCPYHSWTYDLDGRLTGAPFMHDTPGFSVDNVRLRELRCTQWQGFVYVSLDPDAEPFASHMAELDAQVGKYEFSDYVPVHTETEIWNANWKCLVENYMDVYHLHRVHADSFGKYGGFEQSTCFFPGNDYFCYHYVQEDGSEHSVAAHPDNERLQGEDRHRTWLINLFPSHTVQLQPDLLWYLSILPLSAGSLRVRWSVSVPQDFLDDPDGGEQHVRENLELLMQVNREDRLAVERVHGGTAEPSATPGPLSSLERNVWDFGRYLARRLCS